MARTRLVPTTVAIVLVLLSTPALCGLLFELEENGTLEEGSERLAFAPIPIEEAEATGRLLCVGCNGTELAFSNATVNGTRLLVAEPAPGVLPAIVLSDGGEVAPYDRRGETEYDVPCVYASRRLSVVDGCGLNATYEVLLPQLEAVIDAYYREKEAAEERLGLPEDPVRLAGALLLLGLERDNGTETCEGSCGCAMERYADPDLLYGDIRLAPGCEDVHTLLHELFHLVSESWPFEEGFVEVVLPNWALSRGLLDANATRALEGLLRDRHETWDEFQGRNRLYSFGNCTEPHEFGENGLAALSVRIEELGPMAELGMVYVNSVCDPYVEGTTCKDLTREECVGRFAAMAHLAAGRDLTRPARELGFALPISLEELLAARSALDPGFDIAFPSTLSEGYLELWGRHYMDELGAERELVSYLIERGNSTALWRLAERIDAEAGSLGRTEWTPSMDVCRYVEHFELALSGLRREVALALAFPEGHPCNATVGHFTSLGYPLDGVLGLAHACAALDAFPPHVRDEVVAACEGPYYSNVVGRTLCMLSFAGAVAVDGADLCRPSPRCSGLFITGDGQDARTVLCEKSIAGCDPHALDAVWSSLGPSRFPHHPRRYLEGEVEVIVQANASERTIAAAALPAAGLTALGYGVTILGASVHQDEPEPHAHVLVGGPLENPLVAALGITELDLLESAPVLRWGEVPGNDTERLVALLNATFGGDWEGASAAAVRGGAVNVTARGAWALVRLDPASGVGEAVSGDGRRLALAAREENGTRLVFEDDGSPLGPSANVTALLDPVNGTRTIVVAGGSQEACEAAAQAFLSWVLPSGAKAYTEPGAFLLGGVTFSFVEGPFPSACEGEGCRTLRCVGRPPCCASGRDCFSGRCGAHRCLPPPPALEVEKRLEGDPQGTLTVSVVLRNAGRGAAGRLVVTDLVPAGFALGAGSPTVELGGLGPGREHRFRYSLEALPGRSGPVNVTDTAVQAFGPAGEPLETELLRPARVELELEEGPAGGAPSPTKAASAEPSAGPTAAKPSALPPPAPTAAPRASLPSARLGAGEPCLANGECASGACGRDLRCAAASPSAASPWYDEPRSRVAAAAALALLAAAALLLSGGGGGGRRPA